MKAKNFYTANGWAGSNYDSKLQTKDIAKKVREYAKKNFPGFKFSVRTEWSMYTDSMYIELKEGTSLPFVEGSRSAERGYMSTMNTVKGFEKDLTPEMFKVLDAVTTYASSFRYDDSDGVQDYYDTNFYLSIKISDEYKVIEPKAKKSQAKENHKEETTNILEPATVEGLEIVDYSEKAVAVFGDTKAVKEQLKELGGRFNPSLKYNGEKRAGWIFSKKQADEVKKLAGIEKAEAVEVSEAEELPAPPEVVYIPELAEKRGITEELANELAHTFGMSYERRADVRYLFTFNEKNDKGESIAVELCYCEDIKDKKSLPKEWHRLGWTSEVLADYWGISVYATDTDGNCMGYYNPQHKNNGKRNVIDFQYMMRATRANAVKLFGEIKRRAFGEQAEESTEFYPLEGIAFTESGRLDKVTYYDIEGAGIITSAKVRTDIQPGDVFNVYTDKERKYAVMYDGVSFNRSLYNDLPGIIEFDKKLESNILSKSDYYTPMGENVEFYEKRVKGKRYEVSKKPLSLGYVGIVDTLDNCMIDSYPTMEEAEKEAEKLNGWTDENGRLKSVI